MSSYRYIWWFGQIVLLLQVLVLLASLVGIAYFVQSYMVESKAVLSRLDEVVASTGRNAKGPESLLQLTHQVCLLDTSISSVGSFLQPMSVTISSGGWCGNYVRVFIEYAKSQGYAAHKIHLRSGPRSHTAAEIFYEGEWRVVDPLFGLVFKTSSGELATFEDMAQNPSLATEIGVLSYENPQLAKIYESYKPIYYTLYQDAGDFQWDSSPSSIFHDGTILLSYPISIGMDGPRRPIIPYWLDRPELLGAYLSGGVFSVSTLLLFWRIRPGRLHVIDNSNSGNTVCVRRDKDST